ncbi:DegT/DnrJ/EryC1/StrS family aminotransferase [Bacteroidota bacterium]
MKFDKALRKSPFIFGNELSYVADLLKKQCSNRGDEFVVAFEERVCQLLAGNVNGVALNSGTSGLHLGLKILGVKQGDTVVCSTATFAASAFPVLYEQASPVFIDSELETWNMCPVLLEEAVVSEIKKGSKPKAIIVVHSYGVPAKMKEIMIVSKKYSIPVLEDAAQAFGSFYKGKACGSMGEVGVFSFNKNKIISTYGGGMLISKNQEFVEKTRFLATQAKEKEVNFYLHKDIGYNYLMSPLAAAFGMAQLENLQLEIETRKEIFLALSSELEKIPEIKILPFSTEAYQSNCWRFVLMVDSAEIRANIQKELLKIAIKSDRFWNPMHLQPVFKKYKSYTNGTSEDLFEKGLSLSIDANLTKQKLLQIISIIKNN